MKSHGRVPAQYSKLLRQKFGFWPAWLPDSPIRVGDFGRIRGGLFEREGHVESLALSVGAVGPRSFGDQLFASRGVRQVMLGGNGVDIASAGQARARIEFNRGFGVFVGLRDCGENRLDDPLGTAAELSELRASDRWQDDYCLVTGVVNAETALIAIGSTSGGALELSAAVPAPDILTWLGGELEVSSEANLAYRALITSGCSPLFRLSKLAGNNEMVPRGAKLHSPRLLDLDPRADLE